jgi:hypothetical protein
MQQILYEKLIVTQLKKKFPSFDGKEMFTITAAGKYPESQKYSSFPYAAFISYPFYPSTSRSIYRY